jgi:hypothetical protein
MVHMSPKYYQLRKLYYYFSMYNTFLPKVEYMNMLFHYEQVNMTMYAWAPHGDKYRHIGDIVGHEDSDCELEVISSGCIYTLPDH